jgi:hypothetical protein
MASPQDYKLYQIENAAAREVGDIPTKQKRVVMIGGIQDLCRLPIERGTWTAINRALAHDLPQDVSVFAVGKAEKPAWMEDDWTDQAFLGDGKNPPAQALAERLFHLPKKGEALGDKAAFLKQLDEAAGNTVFVTFSTGSMLLQHVRAFLVERLKEYYSEAELSPILAKVGALNIAPIYTIGDAPEALDFTQIAVINQKDPYAGGTPVIAQYQAEIRDRAARETTSWNGVGEKPQFLFMAYEAQLKALSGEAHQLNPNLRGAGDEIIGHIKIDNRNLVIHGNSVPDKYPTRVIYHFEDGAHSRKETPPVPELQKEHEPNLYLHQALTTYPQDAEKYKVVQTFQRFAAAHLIPKAIKTLLGHEKTIDQLAAEITQDERNFVAALLAEQNPIDPDKLIQKRGK